jgi:hypothetical protein
LKRYHAVSVSVAASARRQARGCAVEQPPVRCVAVLVEVAAEHTDQHGREGMTRIALSGRCLRPRGSCGVSVPVRARPVRGQAAVKISFPRPCAGRIAAACAEIFTMLADAIPGPVLRQVLSSGVGLVQNASR